MDGFLNTLKDLGRLKLAIMAIVGLVMITFFTLIAMHVASPAMTPLYTGLSLQDSSKIVAELETQNIPYEIRANGTEVLVPSDRMLRLRMDMATQGLPSGGSIVGYEIFDKQDTLGSSNSVMNINMVRALEGELARTISSFSQVESARVHLVIPKRELFARDKVEPSASVAIKLRGSMELEKQEVASITHFLAAAVPGLKVSHITVVDNHGRLLARGDDGSGDVGAMASNAEEYRVGFETRTKGTLEQLIERIVGAGKVKVQVAADINFDRIVTNSEKFDPEGQVARSVQSSTTKDDAQEAAQNGAVTVANQLPAAPGGAGVANGNKKSGEKSDETTNYEISKTVQNHVKEGGTVNRLSVAVLVDGNYTGDAGSQTYAPRSDEELKRIETLVKSAIGFDEKRGDSVQVVNMQFTKDESTETSESFLDKFKNEMQGIIQTLIISAVVILAILLVIRPAIMHLIKNSVPGSGGGNSFGGDTAALSGPMLAGGGIRLPGAPISGPSLAGGGALANLAAGGGGGGAGGGEEEEDSMIDVDNIKGRIRQSSVKKISQIIDRNPDESINVLRQWMLKEA